MLGNHVPPVPWRPIENSVGTHLAQSLASGLTWVSAAEPDPMSGDGASLPAALGRSSDGTQLAEKLYLSGHRAYGAADVLRIGSGDEPIGMMAAQQTEPTGPSASAFSRDSVDL